MLCDEVCKDNALLAYGGNQRRLLQVAAQNFNAFRKVARMPFVFGIPCFEKTSFNRTAGLIKSCFHTGNLL
jgi:hypothetical protein